MATPLTAAALNFIFTEFRKDFDLGIAQGEPLWQNIATRIPSTKASNTYGWMGDMPGFREWIGPRVFHNIAARAYTVVNKDWEDSFVLPRNMIADDDYGLYAESNRLLGKKAAELWDDLVFTLLEAGTTTVGPDGQFFFDTDHPVNPDSSAAGVYSNSVTAATALNTTNLITLAAQMMGFKREDGKSRLIRPDLLLVPPALAGAAATAVAPIIASNNAAVPNPLVDGAGLGFKLRVLVAPQLTVANVYYLLSTSMLKPIILQVRQEAQFVSRTALTDDNVFHRKEFEFGADARGNAGYGLPFTALRVAHS